ncbi:MAG: xanthine dehydrogenase family protein molybdopterin-binding subunit [Deltaproteobacteria bacterium]|nr:xanthine dehydrogenase family protein molybdopterin-binding subunit [Deltaproteobacteria bacterium]MBW2044158.1 xanthine dehydrogenase family protein molybdopterin-binding subunit [Deltaproteobacteria bacterium]MBW2300543.1 xanthine dehydrogenase family protein molybdopterin-binding subunit [Deltaproteobacteria bacterium]
MAEDFKEMPNNPLEHDKYAPKEFKVLGRRGITRIDGYKKAAGKAIYTRDIQLPGMLYAKFLTSPYPNARISKMDTSKAENLPGVRAVLRYDDPEVFGRRVVTTYGGCEDMLAGYAYFEGQQIGAVVAADTEQIAREALKLIDVEWDVRPFVLDPEGALRSGAPLARPEWADNNLNEVPPSPLSEVFRIGNVEAAFEQADKVIEFKAVRRYHGGADTELPCGIVRWEGDCLELWLHHQHPYEHKWTMHKYLGVPMNKIKVNAPYNGGMYGGWNWIAYSQIATGITAILAKRTARPVKWVFDRREDFVFGSADAMVTYFKVGANKDGTISSVKLKSFYENTGFWAETHLLENTRIPNIEAENVTARVNKGPTIALRCEQLPGCFVMAHVFNHVAAELDMDPTEVALKNDGAEGKDINYLNKFKRKHGFPLRDSLRECIEAGKKAIGWDKKWHPAGAKELPNGKMHGMGFIWSHEWDDNRGAGVAGVFIQQDGSANIVAFRTDIGVNAETTYCQVVAEELGMKFEDVFFRQQDDVYLPLMTPDGSCNLTTNSYVLRKAARKAKRRLLELATTEVHLIERNIAPAFPGMQPEDLEVKGSEIFVKSDPSKRKKIAEVVKDMDGSMNWGLEYAAIQCTTHAPVFAWAYHRQGRYGTEPGRHRLCRQAHFCEIEVDTETGKIEIKKIVNVNDVGKALSPEAVEGQQYGGTYMGIGRNLNEEYVWDPCSGVLLNGNLLEYKWATMLDIGEIETIIVETGMGYGPYGTVGIGEDVATITTYLLESAVFNAIGKWIDDGPITPDKVLKALGKA